MNWSGHWLTIKEFSRMMGRSEVQVLNWTQNGTLDAFGFPVYCASRGSRSRFYIFSKD